MSHAVEWNGEVTCCGMECEQVDSYDSCKYKVGITCHFESDSLCQLYSFETTPFSGKGVVSTCAACSCHALRNEEGWKSVLQNYVSGS